MQTEGFIPFERRKTLMVPVLAYTRRADTSRKCSVAS